jgi:hypothetical protein
MDFFKKAAALALSVLGALFTNVEPPKAQAQPKPLAVHNAPVTKAMGPSQPTVLLKRHSEGGMVVVVLGPTENEQGMDAASASFLSIIESRQSVKHPLTATPWYLRSPQFATQGLDDASALFRALVTNDFVDR